MRETGDSVLVPIFWFGSMDYKMILFLKYLQDLIQCVMVLIPLVWIEKGLKGNYGKLYKNALQAVQNGLYEGQFRNFCGNWGFWVKTLF